MSRFKIGDRAKFTKSSNGSNKYQSKYYIGRKGIVTEVDENARRPDETYGEMVRISFTDGSILNVRDDARNAIHYKDDSKTYQAYLD